MPVTPVAVGAGMVVPAGMASSRLAGVPKGAEVTWTPVYTPSTTNGLVVPVGLGK